MCDGCMPACYLSFNLVALTRLPKHNYWWILRSHLSLHQVFHLVSFPPVSCETLRAFYLWAADSLGLPFIARTIFSDGWRALGPECSLHRDHWKAASWAIGAIHWGHLVSISNISNYFKLQMIAASTWFLWHISHQKKARDREASNWPNSWTSSSHRDLPISPGHGVSIVWPNHWHRFS